MRSWFDLSDFYQKSVALLSSQLGLVTFLIGVIIVLWHFERDDRGRAGANGGDWNNARDGNASTKCASPLRVTRIPVGSGRWDPGLAIGYVLAQIISHFGIPMPPPPGRDAGYSAKILLTPRLAMWSAILALVPATLASLYPAWKASRLPIVDALRHNR